MASLLEYRVRESALTNYKLVPVQRQRGRGHLKYRLR